MNTISTAQAAKQSAVLNKKFNYNGVIMTRREYCDKAKGEGAKTEIRQVRMTEKENKEREQLAVIFRNMPFGNSCHPICKDYYARKTELEKGFFKTVYVIKETETCSMEITKIEYDYMNSTAAEKDENWNAPLIEVLNTDENVTGTYHVFFKCKYNQKSVFVRMDYNELCDLLDRKQEYELWEGRYKFLIALKAFDELHKKIVQPDLRGERKN